MKRNHEGLYPGKVMHRRLRPLVHSFRYSAFNFSMDIDRLDDWSRRLRLFSHNRFNLFSIHDSDHGNGENLKYHLEKIAGDTLGHREICRFVMLCYPRVLGYVFNPLTVYYGLDGEGKPRIVIYEVSNTFGERHTYALAVENNDKDIIRQVAPKNFHVSPFNTVSGQYRFRTRLPGCAASVGILLEDEAGPLLAAHFEGSHKELTDTMLLTLFALNGLMTIKVWLAIHFEAFRLWIRRLPFHAKPAPPRSSVTTSGPTTSRTDMDKAA